MEIPLNIDYKPGRTPEEVQRQRIRERLGYTDTESFRIFMGLIRISEKMKKAKITHADQ